VNRTYLLVAGLSLLGTVLLGVILRWQLAGDPLWVWDFAQLRHGHMHLGYYGVLFPLLWWTLSELGKPVPGLGWTGLYAAAVGLSTVGFVMQGYGPVSIAGSTAVLVVWLVGAWQLRRELLNRGWLSGVPLAIVVASAAIPAVAVITPRDFELATKLVHAFLTLLLLGAFVPALLRGLGARHVPGWLALVLGAALFLGPLPHWSTAVPTVLLGLLLAGLPLRSQAPPDQKLLWVLSGLGVVGVGLGLLPNTPMTAVAGLHLLLLGPVLLGLGRGLAPASLLWRIPYVAGVLGLSGAVLWPRPQVAVWAGSLVAVCWVFALLGRVLHQASSQKDSRAPAA
jgi:hypothetical protein